MKMLIYFGSNVKRVYGVSKKIWKIQRRGRIITAYWGSAIWTGKRPQPGQLRSRTWRLRTEALAIAEEKRRINEKLNEGYERIPPRKPKGI